MFAGVGSCGEVRESKRSGCGVCLFSMFGELS